MDHDGSRVTLRPLTGEDEDEFVKLVLDSAELHHPWMSLPATPERFRAFLAGFDPASSESLLVCLRDSGAAAGMINIKEIIRGRYQGATISYAAFAPSAGRGYLTEGMRLALRHAFEDLRLHRLEANIQPANHASLRLVARAGFRKEGYSPDYLFIDGAWRDHERWAITAPSAGFVPHSSMPIH
ncbi:GNAT family N-acetyltransferase [Actinomadura barringtoniae]|uniref:GNAT family N-acetyltransferase n=1 Tax=Actinomadura barringtoniae TaxID=1427535 RepID=A0A939PDW0_9ACTN|nr:GNAT family protein [Actinomadura barringtoniae]MBO2450806.1 GNAT family N-acetyltransferase [Actinomadura barringtoniae]